MMRSGEDQTLTDRIILTFIIIAIALLLLALIGWLSGGWDAAGEEQIYEGIPLEEHLISIDKRALQDAYEAHLRLLFSVWLKDDISTVHRINNGIRIARRAYGHAAEQIEKREAEIKRKRESKP